MSFKHSLKISASGMSAQRLRMDTIANNLANANTTRTQGGGAYRKQQVTFAPMFQTNLLQKMKMAHSHPHHYLSNEAQAMGGVQVTGIHEDRTEGKRVYEPNHPDADDQGYVEYPNVNVVQEMTDMISATRSYEANVSVVQAMKTMALKALEIGRA